MGAAPITQNWKHIIPKGKNKNRPQTVPTSRPVTILRARRVTMGRSMTDAVTAQAAAFL